MCYIVAHALNKDIFWVYENLSFRQIIGIFNLLLWYRKLTEVGSKKDELITKAMRDFDMMKDRGFL